MKIWLWPVAALVLSFQPLPAWAGDYEEEGRIYDALENVLDLTISHDFEEVADHMHPNCLKHFRDIVTVGYDRLSERWSQPEILSVIGLKRPPTDPSISDRDLFISLTSRAADFKSDLLDSKEFLPIQIVGTVFEGRGQATVLHEYKVVYKSKERSVTSWVRRSFAFRYEDSTWLMYTSIMHRPVMRVWSEELMRRAAAKSAG